MLLPPAAVTTPLTAATMSTNNADFQLDWDLPDYPQLPKMFTNAKAAKKRKHKEFILTDADLDTVVKIPRPAPGASGGGVKRGWYYLLQAVQHILPVSATAAWRDRGLLKRALLVRRCCRCRHTQGPACSSSR